MATPPSSRLMAPNEASLLLSRYAYQVPHLLHHLLESRTHQGWGLRRMRARVRKVATTLTVHARKIIVQLDDASDKYWPTLLKGLPRLTALVCDLAFPSIYSTGEAATSVACKHAGVDARVLVRKVIKTKLCSLPIIRFPAIMHPGHFGMGRYQQLL